jgi:hypothetical protein
MVTTNPCFNCCSPTAPTNPCPSGDCICFCDIYISPNDDLAVPCGQLGTLDVTTYPKNTEVCDTTPLKYVLMYSDADFFESAALTEQGVLTWTPSVDYTTVSGNLVFKVMCGGLAKLVTVTISRKNPCEDVICAASLSCNQCTGVCVDVDGVDLTLTVGI